MHGVIKRSMTVVASGGSYSMSLAKSLKWILTSVPGARSYTTAGSKIYSVGRGYQHTCGFNYPILGARAGSAKLREKTLYAMQSRHYCAYKELRGVPAKEAFLCTKCLPSAPIDFDSPEGKQLLDESSQEGFSEGLMHLVTYCMQVSEHRLCGLASISAVLNTLEAVSEKKMKDRWRFPSEFLLDSCDSFEKVRAEGMSLRKLAFLAYSNGAKVDYFPANGCTIDDFRSYIKKCTSSKDCYMVASFDRSHFKQAGGWHISPIGAYHAGRDLVFVVDISGFEYPCYWIPLELLWESITSIDHATRAQKGFMVLSKLPHDPCIRYTMSCKDDNCVSIANFLKKISSRLMLEHIKDIEQLLAVVFTSCSSNFKEFIKKVDVFNNSHRRRCFDEDLDVAQLQSERVLLQEQLLRQLQDTQLYKLVSNRLTSQNSICELVTPCGFEDMPEIRGKVGRHIEQSVPNLGSSGRNYSTGSVHSDDGHIVNTVELPNQGASELIPSSYSISNGSSSNELHLLGVDVLTMLLFALPQNMWSSINDAKLSTELSNLISIENFPPLLSNEILSLRQQLQLLVMSFD